MWPAIIAALVAFLEPVIQQWLSDLFAKLGPLLAPSPVPADPAVAIHDIFAEAKSQLGFWSWLRGRTALLAALERVALARAAELVAVAKSGAGSAANLTPAECEMLKDLEA